MQVRSRMGLCCGRSEGGRYALPCPPFSVRSCLTVVQVLRAKRTLPKGDFAAAGKVGRIPAHLWPVRAWRLLPNLCERKAYEYDHFSSCVGHIGQKPLPCKWVGVNKGDDSSPWIRSLFVVAETTHQTALIATAEDATQTFFAAPPC